MRLFIKKFLGIDISTMDIDESLRKYEEAKIAREIEVDLIREAIVNALGSE